MATSQQRRLRSPSRRRHCIREFATENWRLQILVLIKNHDQDNYIIPKGTNIVGNHWAVHRDEAYYGPNVEEFKIDRWLDKQGKLKTDMKHFQ